MNRSLRFCSISTFIVAASLAALCVPTASAQVTWSATSPGDLLNGSNWFGGVAPNSVGASALIQTQPTNAGNFTLNGAMTLGELDYFNTQDRAIAGTGTLNLASNTVTPRIVVIGPSNLSIISVNDITSTQGFNKEGSGTLTFGGSYGITGPISINGGTLAVSSMNGQGTGAYSLDGGTLQHYGAASDSTSRGLSLGSGGGTIDVNAAGSGTVVTVSGLVSGAGGLSKIGAGTLTLSNTANSFTGNVIISGGYTTGGYLSGSRIENSGTNSSFGAGTTFDISNEAVLKFTGVSSSTNRTINLSNGNGWLNVVGGTTLFWNGQITGPGSLNQEGPGTLQLNNTSNNYGGATHFAGGKLQLGASGVIPDGSAVTVGSTATFDLNNQSETIGSLTGAGSVTLGNAELITGGNNTSTAFSGPMSGTGGRLVKTGTGTMTLSGSSMFTGNVTISGGTLSGNTIAEAGTNSAFGAGSSFNISNGATLQYTGASALSHRTVSLGTGGGGAISVTGPELLLFGQMSGSGSLTKQGSGILNIDNSSNDYAGGTVILAGSLEGATLTANGNSSAFGKGDFTIDNGGELYYSGGTTSTDRSVTLNSGGGKITVASGGTSLTWSGLINGAGGLTKDGAGQLTLTANNTYTGSTTINSGLLQLGAASATGSLGTGAVINNGTLGFSRSNTLTQGVDFGPISGTGAINKNGAGTTIFNAANTYTGTTNINSGILQFAKTNSMSSGIVQAQSGATIAVNVGGTGEWTNGTSGTASLGRLIAGDNTAGTSNRITWFAGSILGIDTTNAGGSFAYNGSIGAFRTGGDSVGLTKLGTGTLILTAASTYTGPTTISAGSLQLGNGGSTGSLSTSSTITNNGNLTINRVDNVYQGISGNGSAIISNSPITGTGSLTKDGTGTLALSAANTYSGGTTVTAGSLVVNGTNGSIGSGTLTINSGATFSQGDGVTLGGTAGVAVAGDIVNNGTLENRSALSQTYAGTISGSGTLNRREFTPNGSALILTGANTYSGGTTINAGKLLANNTTGSATGTGQVTVNSGGTFGGTGAVSGSVVVNSGGTLAPGASVGALATGALTFAADPDGSGPQPPSSFAYEINSGASLTVAADLVNANGNLSIGSGTTLAITDLGNSTLAGGTKFTLISYSGTWDGGTFAGKPDGSNLLVGLNTFTINYADNSGGANFGGGSYSNFVTLTAVPEASPILFGALAYVGIAFYTSYRKLRHHTFQKRTR